MPSRTQKYHQAAITYCVYGVVYLSGAVYLAESGVVARSGWVWFVIGLVFLLVIPPLIWRGYMWFTRVIAVMVAVRIIGLMRLILNDDGATVPLPGGGAVSMVAGAVVFLIVAMAACAMLVRAGWSRSEVPAPESP